MRRTARIILPVSLAALFTACTITTTTRDATTTPPPSAKPAESRPEPKPAEPEASAPKPEKKRPKKEKEKKAEAPEPKKKPKPAVAKAPPDAPLAKPDHELTADKPEPPHEPQPEVSTIVLPIRASLAALSEQIDALIPKEERRGWTQVTDEGDSPRAEIKATIWRDPVQVTFDDQSFHVTVPLRFAANVRAWVKNPIKSSDWISIAKNESWGTKADPQLLTATLSARLDVDGKWHVTSDLRMGKLEHGPAPTGSICKKLLIDVCVKRESIAPRVNRGIDDYVRPRIEKALAKLEGRLDEVFQLKKRAGQVWSALQKPRPVKLPGAKEPSWVVVDPTAVALSRPALDGSDVRIDLAMQGRVQVVGGKQPEVGKRPLPPLERELSPAGLHVIAELRVPYAALSKPLAKALEGEKLGKDDRVTIKSAKLVAKKGDDNSRRVTLEVELDGATKASLELSGELVYDPASHKLSIDDLDVDQKKGGDLDDSELKALRKRVASKARWNLAKETKPLEQAIAGALSERAEGEVQLEGSLDKLDVRELALGEDGLVAKVIVGGEVRARYGER
jgi:hypothetical protein